MAPGGSAFSGGLVFRTRAAVAPDSAFGQDNACGSAAPACAQVGYRAQRPLCREDQTRRVEPARRRD